MWTLERHNSRRRRRSLKNKNPPSAEFTRSSPTSVSMITTTNRSDPGPRPAKTLAFQRAGAAASPKAAHALTSSRAGPKPLTLSSQGRWSGCVRLFPPPSTLLPPPSPRPSIFSPFPLSSSLGRLLKTPASGQRRSAVARPASSVYPVAVRAEEAVAATAPGRVGRLVPWAAQLEVAEPKPRGRGQWTITRRMRWTAGPRVLPGAPPRPGGRITRPSNNNGCPPGSPSSRPARCCLPSSSSASSSSPLASASSSPPTTSVRSRWGRGVARVPWLPEGDRRAPPSGTASGSSAGFLSLQFWRLVSFCFRSAWLGTERMSGGQDLFIG